MNISFWDTIRGNNLADALTTFAANNPDLEREIARLNDNLEKFISAEKTPATQPELIQSPYTKVEDDVLESAIENDLDIITTILHQMETDSDNESRRLLYRYKDAGESERFAMDDMLVNLCGWSMASIIDLAKEAEDGEEANADES